MFQGVELTAVILNPSGIAKVFLSWEQTLRSEKPASKHFLKRTLFDDQVKNTGILKGFGVFLEI